MIKQYLIKNCHYLDNASYKLCKGSIRITDGVITSVARVLQPNENDIIISEDYIVMPGLINSHLHPSKEIYGSTIDASPIDIVLDSVHKNNSLEDENGQYIASLKSLTAGLKRGVTTFGLFTSRINSDVKASSRIGIRCVINYCQSNQWIGTGSSPKNSDINDIVNDYIDAERKYQSSLISISPATASELSADDALLIKLHELARQKGKKFTLHVHEGYHQVESHKKVYGISAITRLFNLGILDEHITLIHCCCLSEDDSAILLQNKCNIVHCPISNSFVGAGTLPLRKLSSAIIIGLGTDAAMVNPVNSLAFDAIFALYHHGDSDFNLKVNAASILNMLTEGGAISLGLNNVGRIEEGYMADLIAFKKKNIDVDYINTPVSLLKMLSLEYPDIVMVNGNVVVKNKMLADESLSLNDVEFSAIREALIA